MRALAEGIYEIIKDLRNHDGVQITPEKIFEWCNQFGTDRELILTELKNI